MREHLTVLQEMKSHLDNQKPISSNLEILKEQLEQLEVSKMFFMLAFQWWELEKDLRRGEKKCEISNITKIIQI